MPLSELRTPRPVDNIAYPARQSDLNDRVASEMLKIRLKVVEEAYEQARAGLALIFDRIARGEQVELGYPDGTVIQITRARRRASGEGGEA